MQRLQRAAGAGSEPNLIAAKTLQNYLFCPPKVLIISGSAKSSAARSQLKHHTKNRMKVRPILKSSLQDKTVLC